MTAELEPIVHVPGYCSEHPNHRLVTHRRAGVTWWYRTPRTDLAVVCPSRDHSPYDRERCLWCGLSLDEEGRGRFHPKRAYCRRQGDMCRIHAHRARQRGQLAPAAIGARA